MYCRLYTTPGFLCYMPKQKGVMRTGGGRGNIDRRLDFVEMAQDRERPMTAAANIPLLLNIVLSPTASSQQPLCSSTLCRCHTIGDPLRIPCGSPKDPLWIPCGSPVDPLWIPCGSPVDPLWIPWGSPVDPLRIPLVYALASGGIHRGSSGDLVQCDTGISVLHLARRLRDLTPSSTILLPYNIPSHREFLEFREFVRSFVRRWRRRKEPFLW